MKDYKLIIMLGKIASCSDVRKWFTKEKRNKVEEKVISIDLNNAEIVTSKSQEKLISFYNTHMFLLNWNYFNFIEKMV